MEIVILSQDAYQNLINRFDSLDKHVKQLVSPTNEKFINNNDFLVKLKVSKRTAQTWRDEGKISFSQIGNKIYYLESDVEQLLKENYKKAFNPSKRRNEYI